MLGWMYRMIIGTFHKCEHKWDVMLTINLHDANDPNEETIGKAFLLKCAKCGNIKKSRFRFDV